MEWWEESLPRKKRENFIKKQKNKRSSFLKNNNANEVYLNIIDNIT